jgi:hypothetical protein
MPTVTGQPTFSAGEVSPDVVARFDVSKAQAALRKGRNLLLLPQGGAKRRPGTEFIGRGRNNQHLCRLIPFQFNAYQGYALEFSYQKMRVIDQGSYVTVTPVAVTGVFRLDTPGVTTIQATAHGLVSGQDVYMDGFGGLAVAGASQVNGRTFKVGAVTTNTFTILDAYGADIDSTGWSAYTGGAGTAAGVYEIDTPYFDTDLAEVRYEQSADVMFMTHPAHAVQKLIRHGHADWEIADAAFGTQVSPPTTPNATPTTTNTEDEVLRGASYVITAINDETQQESLPTGKFSCDNDLTLVGNFNTVTWATSPSSGVTRYIIYKGSDGIFGYVGSAGPTDYHFKDDNIDPDYSLGPPNGLTPFSGGDNKPTAVGFYEQRAFYGGTNNKPNGIWGSRTGDFQNFDYHTPQRADDGVSFGISARQVNQVQHFVPMTDLLVLTSDTVFKVDGTLGYIAPNSIIVKPQLHRGSSNVRPITIDEIVMYVPLKGCQLRTINYELQKDGWTGTDLTIFAPHLFKGRAIKEMAWIDYPHQTVFVVLDDGTMACLVWMIEQDVWGWTLWEHRRAGGTENGPRDKIESVCAVLENGVDRLYMTVSRYIPGHGYHRYVERMCAETWTEIADAPYLDCARVYSGDPADVISGLEHLEGRAVQALADGYVVDSLTVVDGSITLPIDASTVRVGLRYDTLIHTLPVRVQGSQNRKVQINRVMVTVEDSRAFQIGTAGRDASVARLWEPPLNVGTYGTFSGDLEVVAPVGTWSTDQGVVIRCEEPMPFTLLGVFPEVAPGV